MTNSTTDPPASPATPIPTTYPPGLAWTTLTAANPSLRSWERSAATAGSRGLSWWVRWASGSPLLRSDVSKATGSETVEAYHEALAIVRRRIVESFDEGRQAAEQVREREAAELRRQAAQQAPPPPRRRWELWR